MTTTDPDYPARLIERVAAKHGVALSADDPVLMIHTLNEILLEENTKAHQALLAEFRATLEESSHQWNDLTTKKADSLLQLASKNTRLLTEQVSDQCLQRIEQKLEADVARQIKALSQLAVRARQAAIINLLASSMLLMTVVIVMLILVNYI